MKKVILLAVFMPVLAYGQVFENFENQNISKWIFYPENRWKADAELPISGGFSMHHIFDNPDAGNDRAGIRISDLHPTEGTTRWSFLIRHGYDPSSQNNWSVFIMSENDPSSLAADGTTKGFAVGVNLVGSDDSLRMWKVNGTTIVPVMNSGINWQTTVGINTAVRVTVERSLSGDWSMSVAMTDGTVIKTSTGHDTELFNQGWMNIMYRYSSTRDRLLWIDDVSVNGVFYSDSGPPVVTASRIAGMSLAEITLSEEPDAAFVSPSNFTIEPGGYSARTCTKLSSLTYLLVFDNQYVNKTSNVITIHRVCDKSGNCSENLKVIVTPCNAEPGDVIISEIMADPLPVVGLPSKEYLEIQNRTNFPFNLKNWKLLTEGSEASFSEVIIGERQIIILCTQQDTSAFSKYGKTIGLKQFFTLTDGGRTIALTDSTGKLIHGVEYSSGWYGDVMKSSGGWSLELIDTGFPFHTQDNWKASSSFSGGTPGKINSVSRSNSDLYFKGISNVFASDSLNLNISFSETVYDLSPENIILSGPGRKSGFLQTADPLLREYNYVLSNKLKYKEIYSIEITNGVIDFAGNLPEKTSFSFGLTEDAGKGDIVFNELLFNPLPGDPDYIEFYNRSDKVIDASRLQIVTVDDAQGDTSAIYFLSVENRCILPLTYYAITSGRSKILERYPEAKSENIFEVSSLPSLVDDKGHVVLFNRWLEKIDEVKYDRKMHYSLLVSEEGVALEKRDPESSSMSASNWHSASETSGWGTPGGLNSVFINVPQTDDRVTMMPERVTPDNDGNDDVLNIGLNLSDIGNIVTITVFDENGSAVKKLTENLLVSAHESVGWDCTADDGDLVGSGLYIVLVTLFNEKGKTGQWKKVCAVVRR